MRAFASSRVSEDSTHTGWRPEAQPQAGVWMSNGGSGAWTQLAAAGFDMMAHSNSVEDLPSAPAKGRTALLDAIYLGLSQLPSVEAVDMTGSIFHFRRSFPWARLRDHYCARQSRVFCFPGSSR